MKQIKREPTAKVAVRKSLLKKYNVNNEQVYFLKDGTNFEIELFNPLQTTVMASISIDGNTWGEGLVLKPGERIFLERYLETNNKLLFETYDVDDSEEVKQAIAQNGEVVISFHLEDYDVRLKVCGPPVYDYNDWSTGGNVYTTNTADINSNAFFCSTADFAMTDGVTLDIIGGSSTTTTTTADDTTVTRGGGMQKKSIETGRIEKGEASSQDFSYVNKNFDVFASHVTRFKLMPDSHRPKTSEDLKVRIYCTECGKKANPKDKFCSACGTKID